MIETRRQGFHFYPHFPPTLSPNFCCRYCHIELEFVNDLAGSQPTVVGIAEAKRNDLRRGAIRGEAGVRRGIFPVGTISPLLLSCALFHTSHFWHLETYVFKATYKHRQPLYSSSNSAKPSSQCFLQSCR